MNNNNTQKFSDIYLKPGREASVLRRHPWIFSGALQDSEIKPVEGQVVRVLAHNSAVLGFAHFSTLGIALKMLSFEQDFDAVSFFSQQISRAFELRKRLGLFECTNTNGFRLVHGEGDGLPGLIIDLYDSTAVIQCHSVGMLNSLEIITVALEAKLGDRIHAIYNKAHEIGEGKDRVVVEGRYLKGQNDQLPFVENGLRFCVDWERGQKTGFFLDQRNNRKLLSELANGAKVLNCFSYTGGFSIYAAKGLACEIVSVDASKAALELLDRNFKLNGFETPHRSIEADCLQYLKNIEPDFDLIVLDPPAFIKHRGALSGGIKGYESINLHAIKQIKAGGLIFTFSCSQLLTRQDFLEVIGRAALRAERSVRILNELHQAPCHPIGIHHPEGEYLKGFVLQVL